MLNPASSRSTKKAKDASLWEKAKTRNGKARIGSRDKRAAQIEKLLEAKRWKSARSLLHEELVFDPTSHWLWMHLGLTYYEDKEYETALVCSKRAVELEPRCPLALWHYAGSLYMTDQESAALAIWNLLLAMDLAEVADGDCGEGMDMAMRLLNDVHFRIGRYYQWKGEPELARLSFEKYLHNRAHGVASSYDERQVNKYLAELTP